MPKAGIRQEAFDLFVEILNSMDKDVEKIHSGNSGGKKSREIAEQIRANRFLFEDIFILDKISVQRFLREVSNDDLALALKGSSTSLKKIIFENMSSRASDMIQEDIKFMGPVRLRAVEEAQQKIVEIIKQAGGKR